MTSSSIRQDMAMDKKSDSHYETGGELFPKELSDAVKAAWQARGLTAGQAAEEIGISLNVFSQVCRGGSPKGARKVKAKVKAWLEKAEKS
jgi:hypothetical protein